MCFEVIMWVSTTILSKMESVTSQTTRRNITSGIYNKIKKSKGGHYRIFINQQRTVCYARVSSAKQKTSIETQKRFLLKQFPEAEFVSDIASAFNFKRKGLQALLESAVQGNSICVVVTTKDRLARAGFELIRWIIELSGGQIQILDNKNAPSEQFDTAELIGFITSFCNSHYGKRSAQRRKGLSLQKNKILP